MRILNLKPRKLKNLLKMNYNNNFSVNFAENRMSPTSTNFDFFDYLHNEILSIIIWEHSFINW